MKSGVHSLSIALLLLVNRQESKQETGMVLPQWRIFLSKCFDYTKRFTVYHLPVWKAAMTRSLSHSDGSVNHTHQWTLPPHSNHIL